MTAAHQTARGDRSGRGRPAGAPATTDVRAGHGMVTGDQTPQPARSILITGARGGQGTTTVAAALALHAASVGDAVLKAPPQQGAAAILGHPAIDRGESVAVTGHLTLATPPATVTADTLVVDGGLHDGAREWLSEEQGERYVVLRGPCYVALATLVSSSARQPDGIILVAEDGRSLSARDVAEITGLPVVATVDATPRVARTIDAGLLPSRITRLRELSQLRTLVRAPQPHAALSRESATTR